MHLASSYSQAYKSNKRFDDFYFDDFFNENFLNNVLAEFEENEIYDGSFNDSNQKLKRTLSDVNQMKLNSQAIINFFHSTQFLEFLQELTGIREMLIPDPYMMGGGYHETKKNGFLKLHIDFSKHYKTNLDRRVNVILFLNKGWETEFGGNLVLQSQSLSVSISPLFNRLVIFNTTPYSIHGQPDPVTCPENWSRKSIALYFYSNGRPKQEMVDGSINHSTQFVGRNFKENWSAKLASIRYQIKFYAWSCIPPIVFILRKKMIRWFRSFSNHN